MLRKAICNFMYICTMSNIAKFVVILFAIGFSYIGIGKDIYSPLLTTSFHCAEEELYASAVLESRINDIIYLHRSGENVINPTNKLPTPNSKNHPNDFLSASCSLESGIRQLTLQYLSHAREIHRSLTVSTIIFPFHYFW